MLVRKPDERIKIRTPDGAIIDVSVIKVRGDKVTVGITAPKSCKIHRQEVWDRIAGKGKRSGE
jgi:carbon storage regulator CsrA